MNTLRALRPLVFAVAKPFAATVLVVAAGVGGLANSTDPAFTAVVRWAFTPFQ